ncbi:MAG: polysulfide reductase NrfD [Thermoleophilia bacterium]|nr:polysulfide reductase NrfD [Thermoleophilia bacterium]
MRRRLWIALALGLLFGLGGLAGLIDRFGNGHINANYGSGVPWALWVVFYIYFIGLSAGAFLISSLVYVFGVRRFERVGRLAVFTALICLITALSFIWLDLGHMFRAYRTILNPNFRSPMAWMIWLYSGYFLILLGEGWFLMRRDFAAMRAQGGVRGRLLGVLAFGTRPDTGQGQARDLRVVRVLGTIGVPLAVAFHGGVGALFAVLASRPYWNTGLFPVMFLISALASGGALLTAITQLLFNRDGSFDDEVRSLGRLVLLLLFVDVIMEIAEILISLYPSSPAHRAPFEEQMFGPYWWTFWILGLGMALVGPSIGLFVARRSPRWIGLLSLVAVIGFVGVRWNIVLPGYANELIPGLNMAYAETKLSLAYSPANMEWLVVSGAIGAALVFFVAGAWLFPLLGREQGKKVEDTLSTAGLADLAVKEVE